jgi:hypothetical protein
MAGVKGQTASIGEAMEKLVPSLIIIKNVKWWSHFEKHFGSFSKC